MASLLRKITRWVKRTVGGSGAPMSRAAAQELVSDGWVFRRWEAAEKNRLNRAHWAKATGQSINIDLMANLETLRARSAYELASNPTLEGVINTFCTDVAGRNGPRLDLQGEDDAYNDAMEAVWRAWWNMPHIRGMLGGVDFLRLWVRSLWTNGEYLAQKVSASTERIRQGLAGPITLRLKDIHPRRLFTAADYASAPDVIMGVRQSSEGEPLEYIISDPVSQGVWDFDLGRYKTVPASFMIHRFSMIEEDQVRGVPWLATPLQAVADLRDYDAQVLDAARQAADQAVFWYTDHPDAEYLEVNESMEVERRQQQTGPPGWKPAMLNPTQPQTNYKEYRSERQRDMGRPVGMPLMMVRLDSSNHNYSSARFDGQVYLRGLQALQGWLERRTLNELLEDVRREAELYAAANPRWEFASALRRRPRGELRAKWTWPVPPHVDPSKESTAERTGIETGTLPFSDALAARGLDEDEVIASRARTNRKLAAAGLPPLPTASNSGSGVSPEQMDQIQQLRDAADAAESAGNHEQAATLHAQADAMEAESAKGRAGETAKGAGGTPAPQQAGLNGAQITAMKDVVTGLADGTLVATAARELLIAGGISEEAATRIVESTPVVSRDVNADQVAYQRDVVKLFLADKTVNDVFYNLTDITQLMGNTGLPIDKTVQVEGDEAVPYLPVIAEPGQLVSGDVVKDPQGDIVGGAVEAPADPPAAPPAPPSVPPTPEPTPTPTPEPAADQERVVVNVAQTVVQPVVTSPPAPSGDGASANTAREGEIEQTSGEPDQQEEKGGAKPPKPNRSKKAKPKS